MIKSNQTPAVPLSALVEKKKKIFYEHGKDALELALSVAQMQQEKASRKAERRHQPQAGKSQAEQTVRSRASHRKKRLEEAKLIITKQRAEAKKEKARARKQSKHQVRRQGDARTAAPGATTGAAPRKRVSFA